MSTPTPSLSHLQWRATEWLLAFGPLTASLALDYFVLSPFFDRTSTNAALRMQRQFSGLGMDGAEEEEMQLRRFVGVEFVLDRERTREDEGLFVVLQRNRESPDKATNLAAYYILNDNIYQSPSLYSVINERLLASLQSLTTSLHLLRTNRPLWTPESQFAWIVRSSSASATTSATEDVKEPAEQEEGTEEAQDPEYVRPGTTFNPLLFRALQAVAGGLEPLPLPEPVPVPVPAPAAVVGVGQSKDTSRDGTPAVVEWEKEGGNGNGNGNVARPSGSGTTTTTTNEKGNRISVTGKRKPRMAG